jgi:hypothetical protein
VDALTIVILGASACATAYIWRRIYVSVDPTPMKVVLAVAVAIPVIGPLFWPFLSMPPRTREGVLSSPFKGPLMHPPTKPKWAAVSLWVLVTVLALIVAATHLAVLKVILK